MLHVHLASAQQPHSLLARMCRWRGQGGRACGCDCGRGAHHGERIQSLEKTQSWLWVERRAAALAAGTAVLWRDAGALAGHHALRQSGMDANTRCLPIHLAPAEPHLHSHLQVAAHAQDAQRAGAQGCAVEALCGLTRCCGCRLQACPVHAACSWLAEPFLDLHHPFHRCCARTRVPRSAPLRRPASCATPQWRPAPRRVSAALAGTAAWGMSARQKRCAVSCPAAALATVRARLWQLIIAC